MLVDGVFSGGGVKALAFVGALEVTDLAGFDFQRVAGTSAGAIIAALLAAGFSSQEIKYHMENMPWQVFLEPASRRLGMKRFQFYKWLALYWRMGLYSGKGLEKWLDGILREKGIVHFGDLPEGRLKIVASDLTRGELVIMPDDLIRYGIHPASFPVARAVRMSCSLPFFFVPDTLTDETGKKNVIVDGGILSNFPVWVFEDGGDKPLRPFIGFQLSSKGKYFKARRIKNAIDLFNGLFSTMKEAHDAKYVSKYAASNIVFLPVEDTETANFHLTKKEQDDLVKAGRERTEAFLKKWHY